MSDTDDTLGTYEKNLFLQRSSMKLFNYQVIYLPCEIIVDFRLWQRVGFR